MWSRARVTHVVHAIQTLASWLVVRVSLEFPSWEGAEMDVKLSANGVFTYLKEMGIPEEFCKVFEGRLLNVRAT